MAKRAITQIIDDLDGKVLPDSESETIHFGLNGVIYRIDLGTKNAQRFHKTFDPYIAKSRKVGVTAKPQPTAAKKNRPSLSPRQASNIRHWADRNGYAVKDRGRIPLKVLAAYNAAN